MAETLDCSICLQNMLHPAQLPCGHIFCFLCIKGCALYKRRCPMCRVRFSVRFFDDPKLLNNWNSDNTTNSQEQFASGVVGATRDTSLSLPKAESDRAGPNYAWFYEGYGGWWQYDERTSHEIEESYLKQLFTCEVTIAGYIYTIDLINMTQFRKDHSGRRRRIKRDLSTCEKKGIAGIKLASVQSVHPFHDEPKVSNKSDATSSLQTHPKGTTSLEQSSSTVPNNCINQITASCSAMDLRGRSRIPRQSRHPSSPVSNNIQVPRSVSSSQSPQSNPQFPVSQPPRQNNRRICRSLTRQA